jgi:hypothetical protein
MPRPCAPPRSATSRPTSPSTTWSDEDLNGIAFLHGSVHFLINLR